MPPEAQKIAVYGIILSESFTCHRDGERQMYHLILKVILQYDGD